MSNVAFTDGMIVGAAAALCWGIGDFLAKVAIDRFGPDSDLKALFWTRLFGLVPVLALFFYTGAYAGISTGILPMLFCLGLFNFFAYHAFYRGMKKGEVSVVSPVASSDALITALLGVLLIGESLNAIRLAGVLALLLGIPLVSLDFSKLRITRRNLLGAGAFEAVLAMLGWGVMWTLVGLWGKGLGWLLPIFGIRTTTFFLVSAYSTAKGVRLSEGVATVLPVVIAAGLLDACGYLLSSWAMNAELVSIAAPISSTFPAITVLLAVYFLREKLAPNQIVGIIAILAGVIVISI